MSHVLRLTGVDQLPPHLREQVRAKLDGFQVRIEHKVPPLTAAQTVLVEAISAPLDAIRRLDAMQLIRHPSEHEEQKQFFDQLDQLAALDARYRVAVKRTYAIPNGGWRPGGMGGRYRAEGLRRGVSDIHVALPVGRCAGLYIEMKSLIGDPKPEQRTWLNDSLDLGYASACCRGARQALIVWHAYVDPSL